MNHNSTPMWDPCCLLGHVEALLELQPPNSTLAQLYSVIITLLLFYVICGSAIGSYALIPLTKSTATFAMAATSSSAVLPGAMEKHSLPNTYPSLLPAFSHVNFPTL